MANNKNFGMDDEFSLESILNENFESDETFTLESILAEYKSKAYMAGDKKTPSDVLQRQTDAILREVTGRLPVQEMTDGQEVSSNTSNTVLEKNHELSAEPVNEKDSHDVPKKDSGRRSRTTAASDEQPVSNQSAAMQDKSIQSTESSSVRSKVEIIHEKPLTADDFFDEPTQKTGERSAPPKTLLDNIPESQPEIDHSDLDDKTDQIAQVITDDSVTDTDLRFFETFDFADKSTESFKHEVEETIAQGEEAEQQEDVQDESFFSRIFRSSRRQEMLDDEKSDTDVDEYEEPEEDPDIHSEVSRFAVRVPSLRFRALAAAIICVLMLVITHLYTNGAAIPFGIGTNATLVTGILLIMQMIVMILGIDILISGISDIAAASPGAESLIFVSCLISLLDGFIIFLSGNFENGLPFSLVSACSVFFALTSRKAYYIAMCDSLKTSIASASPYGVISENESIDNRIVLKKIPGAYKGFYSRITESDFGESIYNRAAPMFLIASLLFALITSVGRGRGSDFAHTLSIMTAVSAAFPASAVFALPFRYAASRAKKTGSAIAGWGGASDIYYSDGALLTDEDIYPVGSVSLSGLKLFEGVSQRKAIVYTSSLIIASGSGITKVFEELLRSQGLTSRRTDDFACYDGGGIGAVIDGERVLVGTSAFMNLMGIRIPESVSTKSSVFTAINDELAAVFTINYVPANSVQSALVALLNTKTNILMAVRDFNVTPNSIQQKFKVSMEGVEYMPIETTYRLSETRIPKGSGAAAVLCRGGLAPFAEVITRGRLLKQVTELNTIISVVGTAIALLIMFFLCWTASFLSASAENAFVFMMVIEFCVILLSQTTRKRI